MKRRFPIAIFLGAFLLFLVQPMAGKRVLPRFGGGPSVWTACMLFFQILLLGGYAYAHALTSKLSRRAQGWVHASLVGVALLALPFFASDSTWTREAAGTGSDPVARILLLLALAVGLPYFLLASTGPLLQAWVWAESETNAGSPYRLYALSNIASFLALLSYPVLVEPWIALRTQAWIWCAIFAAYAVTMIALALAESPASAAAPQETAGESPSIATILYWLALAACGSTLLLAATSHICQEVAVIPFLWIVPLAIYLLTFVLCFEGKSWYHRGLFGCLAAAAIVCGCYMSSLDNLPDLWRRAAVLLHVSTANPPAVWKQALADLGIVAAGCMICHGELARSKPAPGQLTKFYLALSAGGALGGVFTALIAPRIFNSFKEFPIAMAACCLLGLLWTRTEKTTVFTTIAAVLLVAAAAMAIVTAMRKPEEGIIASARNFFGVLRVTADEEDGGKIRKLTHGRTLHGLQFLQDDRRDLPTTYYGHESGVGIAIDNHPHRFDPDLEKRHLRIGVIGLGTGTLAAYGREGDAIRFFEINPQVERISNEYFSYRKDSKAHVDVVIGDARVTLEEAQKRGVSEQFDLLAVDAFSSDAIPVHLLTAECAAIYKYHLKPDGLLLLHISNRWLDLKPPSRGLAHNLGWSAEQIDSDDETGYGIRSSTWVIVTGNSTFLKMQRVHSAITAWSKSDKAPMLWRDDFTSLLPIFQY